MSQEKYVQLLTNVIEKNQNKNYPIYLLNHEGEKDYKLALEIQKQIGIDKLEIVNGLNALEIKGLISTAYICISSRFHGVASALNSCVPCVSTGWSHKYQELYDDYKQENCMLPTDNLKECINIIENFLNTENNKKRRTILKNQIQIMRKKTIEMWDKIWNC